MRRTWVASLLVGALAASVVTLAPAGETAPRLPSSGDRCGIKDLWRGIPVRKVQNKRTKEVRLVSSKRKRSGQLVCLPIEDLDEWGPELTTPFGTWQFVSDWRLPLRDADFSKIDLSKNPDNDPCRLRWVSPFGEPWSTSLAWDRGSASVELLPTNRRVRGLVIHTWQSAGDPDAVEPDPSLVNSTLQEALIEATAYWEQQSSGRFGLDLEYTSILHDSRALGGNPESKLNALDSTVDFSNFDFVVMTNDYQGSGSVSFLEQAVTLDGVDIQIVMDIGNKNPDLGRYKFLLKHEMGHALGLPDYYANASVNALGGRFVGNTTLMGMSSSYLTGYERWILGWISDWRVQCITKTGDGEATLASVEPTGSGPALAVFPLSPDQAVVVEHRTGQLPELLPSNEQHLFVYWVNASSTSSIYAGMGEEAESAYCRRGCPRPESFEQDGYQWHLRLPAMVTYRNDQETLRRFEDPPSINDFENDSTWINAYQDWLRRANNVPPEPVETDFPTREEFVLAHNAYLAESQRLRGRSTYESFLSPTSTELIAEEWRGLRITNPPELRNEQTRNPRLQFQFSFTP